MKLRPQCALYVAVAAVIAVFVLTSPLSGQASPVISSISPASGAVGSQVTISGSGFGTSPGSASVNWTPAQVQSWSDTQVVITVGAGTTSGGVRIYSEGVYSNAVDFAMPNPQITSISPTSGGVGTQVTVNGSGFGATAGGAYVNWTPAQVQSWSDTQVVISVGAGTTSGNVLINNGGVYSNAVNFTMPNPQITSISPTSGGVGTQITVTGTGFGTTSGTANVNWTPAQVQSWSDTQVVIVVAAGTTTGGVRLNNGGVYSNSVTFTMPNPQIASITPTSGAVGTQITVTGTGFGASPGTANVNWTSAQVQSWSDTQVVIAVAPGTSSGGVLINNGGVYSNALNFNVYSGYLNGNLQMTAFSNPPQYTPINLSDPEAFDWVHWGLSDANSADRMTGANRISGLTIIGPDSPVKYTSCFDDFKWSNGDVNPNIADACSGLYLWNQGDGFQITVPADTTPKTLKLFIGADGATGTLQASLSDNSAPVFTDSSMVTDGDAAGTYSIDFQAASPGQTLSVTYTLSQMDWGDITIEAAELTPKHPDVTIVQPTADQVFASPTSFTADVQASQEAATIGSVSLFQNGASLLTLNNSPFDFSVSSLAAGNYSFTAQATDSNGLTQTSQPVPVHVVGTGGELVASVAAPPSSVDLTTQGTGDWILLGRVDGFDIDRKANVAPLIGAPTQVDWAYWYGYLDNAITYSAEDGTQRFSPASSGVYSPNPGSGFEFTVNAGLTERTVNVYLGAYRAQGQFEAYLSDGSAAPYFDSSTDSGEQNVSNQVYSLKYHAASEGQTLTIRYTLLNNHNYGNVTLQAVTVDGQPIPTPVVQSLSRTADLTGTLIWIDGMHFGNTSGSVLFNGVAGTVLSWSDTAIEVIVPSGATSGPVTVIANGAQSNSVGFTVANLGGPGPAVTIMPSQLSMLIGESRHVTGMDSLGESTTVSSWTSSDSTIADFSPDPDNPNGPPVLVAKSAGQVTIQGDQATANVTVYAGTSLPEGTVIWNVPGTANSGPIKSFVVQATPSTQGVADLFVVQPSGIVQALKADGTMVWTRSLGVNSSWTAFPDPNGGLIGVGVDGSFTRLDATGTPSWSVRPTYLYDPRNVAIHPDGTMFLLAQVQTGAPGIYVVGIDGTSGKEKFRVPVPVGSLAPTECAFYGGSQYTPITIAPDGNAYLESVQEQNISCSQGGNNIQSHLSLLLLQVGTDGSHTDAEIQGWTTSLQTGGSEFFDGPNRVQIRTTNYSPGPLPYIFLNEIIPDNRGNLLAAWSDWFPKYSASCTTEFDNDSPVILSSSCTGTVAAVPDQAHVSVMTGTSFQNDLVLSGVNYFNGPMVMGEADTAFAIAGSDSDGSTRAIAFNATSGNVAWNGASTMDYIVPVGASAGNGLVITDLPANSSVLGVVRYDSQGNAASDSPTSSGQLQYLASDAWISSSTNGSVTLASNTGFDWASSTWDSPRGPQRLDSASDPKINVTVRAYKVDEAIYQDGEIAAKIKTAHDVWFQKSKISLNWDSTITSIPGCNRTEHPFGCTADQDLKTMCAGSSSQLPDMKTALQGASADLSKGLNLLFTGLVLDKCLDGQPQPIGYTPFDHSVNRYVNYGFFAESGNGNIVAHEIGHMFQLKHYTPEDSLLVDPFDSLFTSALVKIVSAAIAFDNLMCGPTADATPFCPPFPHTGLDPVQISIAEKSAASLQKKTNQP